MQVVMDEPIPWRDPEVPTLANRVVASAEMVVLLAALAIGDDDGDAPNRAFRSA